MAVILLEDEFGAVKSKHSSVEALQRWRDACGIVKNRKRGFRFTVDLAKRHEAASMRRTNLEKLRVAVLVSKAAIHFTQGVQPSDYTVPEEVISAGYEICADELGSIVEGHDLKKLKFHGGTAGIADKLSTSITNGLTTDNDALRRRQELFGINKFTESEPKSFWVFLWEALQDMTLMILIVCAFVSLIVGIATEGWPNGAHDGLGIVASILLVVFVTATSDYRQSLQFRDLDKEKKKISIQVTRDGRRQKMSIYDLLPGDIVHLSIGDQVPADGLFLTGYSVLIDESSLTGESEPVMVNAEKPFMLSGTKVQDGSCKMLVATVGMRTQWGKLMATLSEGGDDETPLQVKLNGVATIIGKVGLFFAVVTFAVLVQKLFSHKLLAGTHWSWSGDDALEMLEYFAIAVTIVVVAVPEGLPLAVTLSLAFAMKKMMNDKALVRHLAACETMGSATTICSDKTGTLTTNHMTVVKSCICMNIKEVSKSGNASTLCSEIPESAVKLLLQSIFNNTGGEVVFNKEGTLEILGTPTETALLEFGLSLGGDFKGEREASKLVKVEPFNSTKKRMGVILELPNGGLRAHCKGASEIVLATCDKVINSNGEVVPLDEESFNYLNVTINQFASEALRTLCLGYMELENGFSADNSIPVSGYTCIGIVGIKDPVRPGVKESVALCRSAGVTVRMVTGDNINTAKAVARECGILTDEGIAIEGPEFREKSMEELLELIPRIQVMARSSPLDKHTLVKHLRTTFGEVVAVIGDGTNDVPVLHEADIGLAMGIAGTEVAKESADVIILDDNFSTIVTVAKWGRSVYINIQKFVQFQLTVNVVALVVNFSSACLTGSAPLTAVQLVWVNMIMDTLGALALATEPPNAELMKRAPVGRKGNFISNVMWRNILGQSLYQFLVIWFLQSNGKAIFNLDGADSDLILNTLIFNSFVFCQVFNEMSSREMEKIDVFKGILDNYVFVTVLSCTAFFQIIIVEYLGTFANTSPLTLLQWFVSVLIGFLGMPIAACLKMIPVEYDIAGTAEKMSVAVPASKAAFQFNQGVQPSDYTVPEEVKSAGFEICADELGSIVEGLDLKKLEFHGGTAGIADKLSTSTTNGLITDGDALSRRQEIFGINKFTESEPRSFWFFLWEVLQDMTLMILAVFAFVSLIVGIATEGWPKGAHDGLGIVAVILLVVFVTATSNYRQFLHIRDLDKEKNSIKVTRDGCRQEMSIYDLLPGDIVHLSIGDQVPADGLFLTGYSVLIDESSLRGESEPVMVNAKQPFILSGTKVQHGYCKMLVATVGMRTQWGKLMATLSDGGDDETPRQVKLNGVATIISKVGLFFAVVTLAVLVQTMFSHKLLGTYWSWSGDDALEMLEYFANWNPNQKLAKVRAMSLFLKLISRLLSFLTGA